jgi:hypothetical protein
MLMPLSDQEIAQIDTRAKVQAIAAEMLKYPQVDCPLLHHFSPGLYIRELHIPAGALTVGKIHKLPCQNLLAVGERTTWIIDGMRRIRAPHAHWTPPGHQRISYTHQDSVWMTFHPNSREERNIAVLERELFTESEEEYLEFRKFLELDASNVRYLC